jgi:hypothetical protein
MANIDRPIQSTTKPKADSPGTDRSTAADANTTLIGSCRRKALELLPESLTVMFDKADDALFDIADKAESNQEQHLYFDAMREVRLRRGQIERDFKKNFVVGFQARLNGGEFATSSTGEEPGRSLIATDEVEENLAITNLVEKIRATAREQLFALDKRIGLLLDQEQLSSGQNPFSPETICEAFKEACEGLDTGIEVKLILLKLFDKHVGADIPQAVHVPKRIPDWQRRHAKDR